MPFCNVFKETPSLNSEKVMLSVLVNILNGPVTFSPTDVIFTYTEMDILFLL